MYSDYSLISNAIFAAVMFVLGIESGLVVSCVVQHFEDLDAQKAV